MTELDRQRIDDLEFEVTGLREEVKGIKDAFPDKDFSRHHAEHADRYKSQKNWADVKQEVIKHIAKAVAWLIVILIGTALWQYFLAHIRVT